MNNRNSKKPMDKKSMTIMWVIIAAIMVFAVAGDGEAVIPAVGTMAYFQKPSAQITITLYPLNFPVHSFFIVGAVGYGYMEEARARRASGVAAAKWKAPGASA